MYNDKTDDELLKLTVEGNDAAFGSIVTKYSRLMYSLAYRILRSKTTTEEVVQESFIKLWKNAASWKAEFSSVSTWIYKITYNTAIDYKRKLTRHPEQELDENFSYDVNENENIEKEELANFIEKLLCKLPEAQQASLIMYYKDELKQQEIAKILGVSVKAVESNILRGKRKLREIIEEKGIKLTDFEL